MTCPYCKGSTQVVNSRPVENGKAIKRRRECLSCSKRFSSYERMSLGDLKVVKRSGGKERSSRHTREAGLRKALEKRPISEDGFQKLLVDIENDLFSLEKDTVTSEQVGRAVLSRLQKADKVGYLRFASVYRNFKSPKAFEKEIQKLEKQK